MTIADRTAKEKVPGNHRQQLLWQDFQHASLLRHLSWTETPFLRAMDMAHRFSGTLDQI
jgi:hypothetical protein